MLFHYNKFQKDSRKIQHNEYMKEWYKNLPVSKIFTYILYLYRFNIYI